MGDFPINRKAMTWAINQARRDKSWANKALRNKKWLANSSTSSIDMVHHYANVDVKAHARDKYDYLYMRSHAAHKSGYVTRYTNEGWAQRWKRITGKNPRVKA